jgi:ATP-dependent RNA helicase RhlE
MDIDDLSAVINFDIPDVPETYVHRIGRTGRAGATGRAVAFCTPDEKGNLKRIEHILPRPIPVIDVPVLPENVAFKTVQTPQGPNLSPSRSRFIKFRKNRSKKSASKNRPAK